MFLGSGLSSSAAFVCSSMIAIMSVFGENFEKVFTQSCFDEMNLKALLLITELAKFFSCFQKELAQLTCECERHIGTQSGGMDQVRKFLHWNPSLSLFLIDLLFIYCNRQSL